MKKMGKNSGQALVIILLVLVVILTVGLALVSRTVTDIKLSGQTELSNRAFNAAEAGVEAVLGGGSAQNNVVIGEGTSASTYSVSTTTVGGTNAAFILNQAVAKDNTQQIWFIGHKTDGTLGCTDTDGTPLNCFNSNLLTLYWGNPGQSINDNNTPALEVTIIYKNASGYQIAKAVYDPYSARTSNNHFINTGVDTSGGFVPPYNLAFKVAANLSDPNGPFKITGIGAGSTLYAARLRLLYNGTPQLLGAQPTAPASTFPIQGKIISSSGSAGNVTRKVQVFESYPYLPGIFDFVLFSGSNTSLSK